MQCFFKNTDFIAQYQPLGNTVWVNSPDNHLHGAALGIKGIQLKLIHTLEHII